jgi:NifU-like protein involved in Fe-S cluster formation
MDASGELQRRFRGPRAYGCWLEADRRQLSGSAEDRSQLVWVRFDLQLNEGCISAVRFQVLGCPHTMAVASRFAESLPGQPLKALHDFDPHEQQRALDVPADKLGRLLVIEDAVRACSADID